MPDEREQFGYEQEEPAKDRKAKGYSPGDEAPGCGVGFLCFVLDGWNCIPATFPSLGGSISSVPAPYFPRHNPCGSGGLQCTIFEQNSSERDSIAPAERERAIIHQVTHSLYVCIYIFGSCPNYSQEVACRRFHSTHSSSLTPLPPKQSRALPIVRSTVPRLSLATLSRSWRFRPPPA